MSKPQSPCYKCPDRNPGCHATCDKYIKFRKDCDEYNQMIKDIKYKEDMIYSASNAVRRRVKSMRTKK